MHSAVRARQNVKVLKKYTIYYFFFTAYYEGWKS